MQLHFRTLYPQNIFWNRYSLLSKIMYSYHVQFIVFNLNQKETYVISLLHNYIRSFIRRLMAKLCNAEFN